MQEKKSQKHRPFQEFEFETTNIFTRPTSDIKAADVLGFVIKNDLVFSLVGELIVLDTWGHPGEIGKKVGTIDKRGTKEETTE